MTARVSPHAQRLAFQLGVYGVIGFAAYKLLPAVESAFGNVSTRVANLGQAPPPSTAAPTAAPPPPCAGGYSWAQFPAGGAPNFPLGAYPLADNSGICVPTSTSSGSGSSAGCGDMNACRGFNAQLGSGAPPGWGASNYVWQYYSFLVTGQASATGESNKAAAWTLFQSQVGCGSC